MTKQEQSKEYREALSFLHKELDRMNREGREGNYKNAVILAIQKLEEFDAKINSKI